MKKHIAAFGLLIALAACSTDQPVAKATTGTLPPKIVLNVQSIALADRSNLQGVNSPYNTNHFTPTIGEAVKQWASDRLQAGGSSGQAIVVIKDASLTAVPLPVQTGMDSWFTRQQGSKYVGRAEVTIEANGVPGFATAEASATRMVTLPENANPIEKQDAYYSMLNGLMRDLGTNLEGAIHSHMSSFTLQGGMASPMNVSSDGLPLAPPMPAAVAPASSMPSGMGQAVPTVPLSGYGQQ